MSAFAWLESMSVGIEEFDHAHQAFFTFLNSVAEALEADDQTKAASLCSEMLALAVEHGEREAEFLRRNGYYGMQLIEETQKFTQSRIEGLRAQVTTDPAAALAAITEMKSAIVHYLLRGDINYKSFVDNLGGGVIPLDEAE